MNKTGLKKIGIIDNVNPAEETQQGTVGSGASDRGSSNFTVVHWFSAFDQQSAVLEEKQTTDENGSIYRISISFTVRKEDDIHLADEYSGREIMLRVETVGGKILTIGTEEYPVILTEDESYDGITTHEKQITAEYSALFSIL